MNEQAVAWLDQNWSPETLPDNQWVAVGPLGVLASAARFESVLDLSALDGMDLDEIVFCYVTFDIWQ